MKPYYDKDGITIYHGDCRDILSSLSEIELLLTDPPYGINWNCDYASRFKTSAKSEGGDTRRTYPPIHGDDKPFDPRFLLQYPTVVLWGAPCFLEYLGKGTLLIWYKRDTKFLAQAEAAWMNKGYGVYIYSEHVTKIQSERKHPTQKPVGLMKWSIEKSNTKGLIVDPFVGSGTILVAAKELGRQAIGIEIEERYCEIAAERLRQGVLKFE